MSKFPSPFHLHDSGVMFEILLMVLGALVSGLWNTLGHPGAMLDAILAPFDSARWMRHNRYKVDRYYRRLTKGSLQSGLRSGLLAGDGNDTLAVELRQAARQKGPLHRLFDEFAVDGRAGRQGAYGHTCSSLYLC